MSADCAAQTVVMALVACVLLLMAADVVDILRGRGGANVNNTKGEPASSFGFPPPPPPFAVKFVGGTTQPWTPEDGYWLFHVEAREEDMAIRGHGKRCPWFVDAETSMFATDFIGVPSAQVQAALEAVAPGRACQLYMASGLDSFGRLVAGDWLLPGIPANATQGTNLVDVWRTGKILIVCPAGLLGQP